MKLTIEVPDEVLELAERLRTQDNACTENPAFEVQEWRGIRHGGVARRPPRARVPEGRCSMIVAFIVYFFFGTILATSTIKALLARFFGGGR